LGRSDVCGSFQHDTLSFHDSRFGLDDRLIFLLDLLPRPVG
jgi:hypothetical protein